MPRQPFGMSLSMYCFYVIEESSNVDLVSLICFDGLLMADFFPSFSITDGWIGSDTNHQLLRPIADNHDDIEEQVTNILSN
jgi:hypothetical protein